NMVVVLIGQFIKNIGGLPCAYVFMALFADVLDHIEWKHGFRVDGLSTSILTIILTVAGGVSNGLLNFMLSKAGYVAPEFINGETVAAVQNAATQKVITFGFLGFEVITAVIMIVLLAFLNVEKNLDKEQAEIKARKGITDEKEA
ncbi:MAG: MFS transporter, partial [Acutalibacteraceae bacterium]